MAKNEVMTCVQELAESLSGPKDPARNVFIAMAVANLASACARSVAQEEIERAESLIAEGYWCGCVREARWTRCERHLQLDHDEEPEPRQPSGEAVLRGLETYPVSDKPPTVAPVSGEPGGVRVVWTEEAVESVMPEIGTAYDSERYDTASRAIHAALPHLRVEVDRETLEDLLNLVVWNPDMTVESFATRLGLTLSDGGIDG